MTAFSGWDFLDNQVNFVEILMRCSFVDADTGDLRTVQGTAIIENTTLSYSPGTLVKNAFQLQGSGKMDIFDGYVPCSTTTNTITVGGQTAEDGILHISYTYTGEAYQIKYRLDGIGDYAYALADEVLNIPGLSIGSDHSIEIIPICANGYEGTGLSTNFEVTQAQTCDGVITDITVLTTIGGRAIVTYTGSATQMKYRIDGGPWSVTSITAVISLGILPVGAHTIEAIPFCSNNVEGTGFTKSFTILVQPALGNIAVHSNIANSLPGLPHGPSPNFVRVYMNGVLTILSPGSGTTNFFSAPNGAVIKGIVGCGVGFTNEITTTNETLITTLDDQVGVGPSTLQFSFVVENGNSYRINGLIVQQ